MRIDIDTIGTFTAAAHAAVLATLDLSGAEYAAVGIIVSASSIVTTGSVDLIPADSLAGTNVFKDGDIFFTANFTAAGKYMISRVGQAFNASKAIAAGIVILSEGFLLPPPLKYAQLVADIQGGGTITGTVIAFRYVR